jgi:hypothetical protein
VDGRDKLEAPKKRWEPERRDRLIKLERRTEDTERDKWTDNISSILIWRQGFKLGSFCIHELRNVQTKPE